VKLINQISQIKFSRPYKAAHGIYKFTITEFYPGLAPVSYKCVIGDWRCDFIKDETEGFYRMVFADNPFEQFEEKAENLGCDIEIYPCFAEQEQKVELV